jgi:hypothetical protein
MSREELEGRVEELERQLQDYDGRITALNRQIQTVARAVAEDGIITDALESEPLAQRVDDAQRTAENAMAVARTPAGGNQTTKGTKKNFAKRLSLFAVCRNTIKPSKGNAVTTKELKAMADAHDTALSSRTILDAWESDEDSLTNQWDVLDVSEISNDVGKSKRLELKAGEIPETMARGVAEDDLSSDGTAETLISRAGEGGGR